jgi:HD-like signal output (HDOD) protein
MKTLVLTCSLVDFMRRRLPRVEMQRFWQHSILTALLSERIARWLDDFECDQSYQHAYLAGLLHDVGMLPLLVVAAEENAICKDACSPSWGSSLDQEKEYFGLDHCEVGQLLGPSWDFFPASSDVITNHHRPGRASCNSYLTSVIAAADNICEIISTEPASAGESHDVLESSQRDDFFALCFPEMDTNKRSDLIEMLETEYLHLLPLLDFGNGKFTEGFDKSS